MKLMAYSTNDAADILCQLAPYLDNIATDKDLMESIGKAIQKTGLTRVGVLMEALHRVFLSIPVLLKTHRNDIFGIVGAVNRKTIDEVAAQSLKETKDQLKEMLEDEDLLDFFGMFGSLGGGA